MKRFNQIFGHVAFLCICLNLRSNTYKTLKLIVSQRGRVASLLLVIVFLPYFRRPADDSGQSED